MFKKTVYIAAIVTLCASASPLKASYSNTADIPSISDFKPALLVAQTRSKQRRDNRQDDRGRSDNREERGDCRDEEGLAGQDKRNCKQDARTGKDEKDKDKDKDGSG